MKTKEHMDVEAHCKELHKALDEISAVLRTPFLRLADVRQRIAQIIVQVRKPD